MFDWSMQFQHTTPFFSLQQNIWAFGPIVIIGDIGMTLLVIDFIKEKSKKNLILFLICLWSIGFNVFLSFTYIKFIRYNAPLILGLMIGFSYLMHTYRKTTFANIFFFIIIFIQIIYGLMFSNIYRSPHTTINATTWIANNLPTGANILREDWNNIIRYDKELLMSKNFRINSINFYTLPDNIKIHTLANQSFINSYIILDSPKVKNVMQRLDQMYPVSSTWYRLIENGELGFVKVAEFKEYPHIGRFEINDEWSEETFTVFDHPSVYIYAKNRILTEEEIYNLLISAAFK